MLTPQAWWIVVEPVDLRRGIDGLLTMVNTTLHHDALAGAAYIFRNRAGTRIKVVCADGNGVWLCLCRWHRGHFVWPRAGDALWSVTTEEFGWLCTGIDWHRVWAKPLIGAQI
jgi:transposase